MKVQTTLCQTISLVLLFSLTYLPITAQQNCVELYGIATLSEESFQVSSFASDDNTLSNITIRSNNNVNKRLIQGTTTVNPTAQHVYFIEADETITGDKERLVVANNKDGTFADFPIADFSGDRFRELEYHCSQNNLYSLLDKGNGNIELVIIDLDFDAAVPNIISLGTIIIPNGHQVLIGSSTLDDLGRRYFFASTDNAGNYTIHTITINGFGISRQTADITTAILDLNYHSGLNQLVTLTSDLDLVGLDADNPTNITTYGRVNVFETGTPLGIDVDPLVADVNGIGRNGELFFFMEDNNTYKLYTVDIITATTINPNRSTRFTTGPILDLVAAIPCQAKANFDHQNTCIGETVQFKDLSVGATQWLWDFDDPSSSDNTSVLANPTHVFSGLGTYNVRLQIEGCVGVKDTILQVTIVGPPTITLPTDTVLCGNEITLDAGSEPDVLYQWSNGSMSPVETFTGTGTVSYKVTAARRRCVIEHTINVTYAVGSTAEVSIIGTGEYCEGDTVILSPDLQTAPQDTYLWSNGETTSTIEVTTTGSYQVTITQGMCTRTGEAIVNFEALPEFSLGADIDTCANSVQLTPRQADGSLPVGAYRWSTGSTQSSIDTDISGIYSLEVALGDDCKFIDSVEVMISQPFTNNDDLLGGVDDDGDGRGLLVGCATTPYTFDGVFSADDLNGNTDITWTGRPASGNNPPADFTSSDPAITIDPNNVVSPYLVQVLAVRGRCRTEDEVELEFVSDFGDFDIASENPVRLCDGESAYLAPGVRGVNYAWSTNEGTDSILVSTSGTYSVTISNGGCTSTSAVDVLIQPPLSPIDLGGPHQLCLETGTPLLLDANTTGNFVEYTWLPTGETTANIAVLTPGTYSVEATDANGCTATGTTEVEELCAARVVIPTAFSPNNDNMNDEFKVVGQFVEEFKLQVFNRWGQLVTELDDIAQAWDGLSSDEPQPAGVYIWLLEFTDAEGNTQTQQGNVYLIR